MGAAYAKNFTRDLDELWTEVDNNNDGVLDKDETKAFLAIIKKNIAEDRAKNYDEERDFEKFFTFFDEDNNGYIAKSEMTVLLKKVFAKSPEAKALEKADKNKKNEPSLADNLGDWKNNLTGDIDAIYKEVSTDKKILTKNQSIEFFDKIKLIVKSNMRFSKAEFDKKYATFDKTKFGMIEKHELVELIKSVYKEESAPTLSPEELAAKKAKARDKKVNKTPFADKLLLGPEYVKRFNGNLDDVWN